jgi:outer membrane protein assembly factor BamB
MLAFCAGGGNVYVKVGQTITAFAGVDGSQRWAAPIPDAYASSSGPGVLYVSSTSGSVTALKVGDGSIIWQAALGQPVVGVTLG